MFQVRLDVRGVPLWLLLPHGLWEPEDGPAGLREGGAVDAGRHPVPNSIPAFEVSLHIKLL